MISKVMSFIAVLVLGFEIGWHTAIIESALARAQAPAEQADDGSDEEESLVPATLNRIGNVKS